MKENWRKFSENEVVKFIGRTIFYLAILAVLVYLYSYSGIDQPHFIYNEF